MRHARWINYYSSFMLRLGHVKALVSLADVGQSADPFELKEALYKEIGEWKHPVPVGEVGRLQNALMHHYSNKTLTEFGATRKKEKKEEREQLVDDRGNPVAVFALQDLYIFDEQMPSHLGTATRRTFGEVLKWAVSLGLLETEGYRLTSKGLLLKNLMKRTNQIEAYQTHLQKRNPYILGDERILFLFMLLQQDGYVLTRLLPRIETQTRGEWFDASLGGQILYEALKDVDESEQLDYESSLSLRQLLGNMKKQTEHSEEEKRLQRNYEFLKKEYEEQPELFENAKKTQNHGLQTIEDEKRRRRIRMQDAEEELLRSRSASAKVGVKEMRAAPRLEGLVDLGLLVKKAGVEDKRDRYEYRTNDCTKRFNEKISMLGHTEGDSVEILLRNRFFDLVNDIYGCGATRTVHDDDILDYLVAGYDAMKNPFGLAEIEDAVLFALISQIRERKLYFEIEDANSTLKRLEGRGDTAHKLSTHVDSLGRITMFSLRNR